jgi:uncharacterized protein
MNQIKGLYIIDNETKGRGVFTSRPIQAGDLIEVCPVIIMSKMELPIIHKTSLHDYYFLWGEQMDECALALGYGSIYNHAIYANADFILDMEHNTIDIVAIAEISPGSEITLNYHGETGDDSPLWFDVNI